MGFHQFRLFTQRRFLPFFCTQAFGAFNDNVYKNSLLIIVTFNATAYSGVDPALLANLGNGLFILPYVIFSGVAGEIADRFDRALLMRAVKWCECFIMVIAGCGFMQHNIVLLLGALFLMGAHSTFFAPAKYGLLPDVLAGNELVGGNALLEMGTFVAILLGTLVAGLLSAQGNFVLLVYYMLGFAIIGLVSSLFVPRLAPAAPHLQIDWNLVRSSIRNLRAAQMDRVIFVAVLGISWFWFYGAVVLAQLPLYAKLQLHGTQSVVTLLLLCFSLGVGLGSLSCERLSRQHLEVGLVPFGAAGLSLFGIDLYFASQLPSDVVAVSWRAMLEQSWGIRILCDLTLIGVSGGVYIVPLYALIQQRAPRQLMARIISAVSIWNAVFMVGAALLGAWLLRHGFTIPSLFLLVGTGSALVMLGLSWRLPMLWLRALVWLVGVGPWRPRLIAESGAELATCSLLIGKNLSFGELLCIAATVQRPKVLSLPAGTCWDSRRRGLFGTDALPLAADDPKTGSPNAAPLPSQFGAISSDVMLSNMVEQNQSTALATAALYSATVARTSGCWSLILSSVHPITESPGPREGTPSV